jgi:hypothetical protein
MRELRCIIYGKNELATALKDHRRRAARPLPAGNLVDIKIDSKPNITVTLSVVDDGGHPHIIPFAGAELAAALIAYCIDQRVPVPVSAKKSLTLIEGQVALKITMDSSRARA